MAIVNGLFGRMSGRLGSTVFYGGKGAQAYSRIHIPNPKNPSTARQQVSRMLFNEARRLVNALAATGALKSVKMTRTRVLGNLIKDKIVYFSNDGVFTTAYSQLPAALNHSDLPVPRFNPVQADGDLTAVISVGPEMPDYSPYLEPGSGRAIVAFAISDDLDIPVGGMVPLSALVSSISLAFPQQASGVAYHFYAAILEVPEPKNGVAQNQIPFMYPSKITEFAYLGNVSIE